MFLLSSLYTRTMVSILSYADYIDGQRNCLIALYLCNDWQLQVSSASRPPFQSFRNVLLCYSSKYKSFLISRWGAVAGVWLLADNAMGGWLYKQIWGNFVSDLLKSIRACAIRMALRRASVRGGWYAGGISPSTRQLRCVVLCCDLASRRRSKSLASARRG